MLVEEFEAYWQVQTAFEKLHSTYRENLIKYDDIKKQFEETINSEKKSYGFFSKVSKEDLVASLRQKIEKLEYQLSIESKLIAVIAEILIREEIPLVKIRKRERFNEIVTEFALARVNKLKQELAFWDKVLEKNDDHALYESEVRISHMSQNQNQPKPNAPPEAKPPKD